MFFSNFPSVVFFLFSDSSHLCLSIFPHCRKVDLRISFDKKNPLNLSNMLIENCYHHCSCWAGARAQFFHFIFFCEPAPPAKRIFGCDQGTFMHWRYALHNFSPVSLWGKNPLGQLFVPAFCLSTEYDYVEWWHVYGAGHACRCAPKSIEMMQTLHCVVPIYHHRPFSMFVLLGGIE